jgi:AcrR family transcriptional regulator
MKETRWFHDLQLPVFPAAVKNAKPATFLNQETCKFPNSSYDTYMAGHGPRIKGQKNIIELMPESADSDVTPRMLALIEAAESIFLSKGFHAATMNDVARAAGMSKKTVYTLIESKAELFAELLSHYQSKLSFPAPEHGATVKEILTTNLICLARFLLSPSQIAILRLIMAEYTHSPELGRLFVRNHVTKAKMKLEDCLMGTIPKDSRFGSNPKEMSAMLFGMAIGEFHLGVLIGFRAIPTKATLEKRVREAVDIFLAGCDGICGK